MSNFVLTSLVDLPVEIAPAESRPIRFSAGAAFRLPITVTSNAERPLSWSSGKSLTVSYRWFNEAGDFVQILDTRSYLPGPVLLPHSSIAMNVEGITPEQPGTYDLQVSLILENVHWAADIGRNGWVTLPVNLTPPFLWPKELKESPAAKAIRGALAAVELANALTHHPVMIAEDAQGEVPTAINHNSPTEPQRRETDKDPGLRELAVRQQRRINDAIKSSHSKDLRIDRLERELELAKSEQPMGPDAKTFQGMIDELRQSLASLQETQESVHRELRGGAAVLEITNSLRQLVSWTATGEENTESLRKLIAWTESTKDLSKIANIEQTMMQVRELFTLMTERTADQRAAIDVQHDQTLLKLDALLARQIIEVPTIGLVLVRNRFGLLAVQDDDPLAIAYYSSGELPEPGTVALIDRILQPGDQFVDVGANIGIYSLIAARRVGAHGKVAAIEPTPSTMRALRTTLEINGVSSVVHAHECALGSKEGTALLQCEATSGHNSLLPSVGTAVDIQEVRIEQGDKLLAGWSPVLIKIDVEGWELDVLDGFSALLQGSPATNLIVEYSPEHVARLGLSAKDWLSRLRSFGRNIWRIDDLDLTLRPVAPSDFDASSFNLLLANSLPPSLETMLG